jgi:hypothetical protein
VSEESARSAEVKQSFEDSGVKSEEEQHFHMCGKAQKLRFHRGGKKEKVEALGNLELFQV